MPFARLSKEDVKFAREWSRRQAVAKRAARRRSFTQEERQLHCMLNGQPFKADSIELSNDILTFQGGKGFQPSARVTLFLFADHGIAEQAFIVRRNHRGMTPHIHLGWKEGDKFETEIEMSDYELDLRFSEETDGKVNGMIALNIPKYQCQLKGPFVVELPKDYTKPPTDADKPYVTGDIDVIGDSASMLSVGFSCFTPDSVVSEMTGVSLDSSMGTLNSWSGGEDTSSALITKSGSPVFQHLSLPPGQAYVYAKVDNYIVGQWVEIQDKAAVHKNLKLDLRRVGHLVVKGGHANDHVRLTPLYPDQNDAAGSLDKRWRNRGQSILKKLKSDEAFTISGLRPGPYQVNIGSFSKDVQIKVNAKTELVLPAAANN